MIEFEAWRFSSGSESSLGLLFEFKSARRRWLCFTLEDEFRTIKKFEETRIPAGTYFLSLRTHGGHHERYKRRFGTVHHGMIEIESVPGFTDVLIHIGNKDDDTAGCLLLGDTAQQNITEDGFIGASKAAYVRVYPTLARAVEGEGAQLTIKDVA